MVSIIGVIILLITVHLTSPKLTVAGELPSQTLRILTVGVTVGSTLFTMLVSSRIQHGLLRSLEAPIRDVGVRSQLREDRQKDAQPSLAELDTKWRGALRIGNLGEMVSNWRSVLMFILAGLNTTSIVTSLTPNSTFQRVAYAPVIPDAGFGEYNDKSPHPCAGVSSDPTTAPNGMLWNFVNGSVFYASVNDTSCPGTLGMFLAPGVNTNNPDDYAYTDLGVEVTRSAMGTPSAVYNGSALREAADRYGLSLNTTSQCVPVMRSTPFQCKPGGSEVMVANDQSLTFNMDFGGGLNHSKTIGYQRNMSHDSAMISAIYNTWTDDPNPIPLSSTLYIGGYTDPQGQVPFANFVAQMVNEPDRSAGTGGGSTYTVSCFINPNDVFEYRTVMMGRRPDRRQYLYGGDPCTPVSPTISKKMFAAVSASLHRLLREGYGLDGYLGTVVALAGGNRGPPYAFNNSRNALEDALGVLAAMAVARIPLDGAVAADGVGEPAYATVQVTRLGSDSAVILFLLIPPVCCLCILAYLFRQSFRSGWQPGGLDYAASERPRMYTAESLAQLLALRKISPASSSCDSS